MKTTNRHIVNGKEVKIDIIGRRNDRETYVFLRTPSKWRGDLVYGINYDIIDRRVRGFDKFRDEVSRWNWDRENFTQYGTFLDKWTLGNRRGTIFHVHTGGSGPGSGHDSEFIEKGWSFDKEVKQKERDDLEKILEILRGSHIDFALRDKTYEDSKLKFEFVGEDPEEVVRRSLEALERANSRKYGRVYPEEYYSAEHPQVNDVAIIHHPLKVVIRRKYAYGDTTIHRGRYPRTKDATYEFPDGKILSGGFPFIFPLKNPSEEGACFVNGNTGSRFLDANGNITGVEIGFPERIQRFEGTFRNSSGREVPYAFVLNGRDILDYNGNRVASMGEAGFLLE